METAKPWAHISSNIVEELRFGEVLGGFAPVLNHCTVSPELTWKCVQFIIGPSIRNPYGFTVLVGSQGTWPVKRGRKEISSLVRIMTSVPKAGGPTVMPAFGASDKIQCPEAQIFYFNSIKHEGLALSILL